jgi:hypothetical protein
MTPDDVAKAFETQLVAALAPKATNADFDKLRQFIEKVPGPDAAQACLRRYLELFGKHENTTTRSRTLATFYLVLKRRIEVAGPADDAAATMDTALRHPRKPLSPLQERFAALDPADRSRILDLLTARQRPPKSGPNIMDELRAAYRRANHEDARSLAELLGFDPLPDDTQRQSLRREYDAHRKLFDDAYAACRANPASHLFAILRGNSNVFWSFVKSQHADPPRVFQLLRFWRLDQVTSPPSAADEIAYVQIAAGLLHCAAHLGYRIDTRLRRPPPRKESLPEPEVETFVLAPLRARHVHYVSSYQTLFEQFFANVSAFLDQCDLFLRLRIFGSRTFHTAFALVSEEELVQVVRLLVSTPEAELDVRLLVGTPEAELEKRSFRIERAPGRWEHATGSRQIGEWIGIKLRIVYFEGPRPREVYVEHVAAPGLVFKVPIGVVQGFADDAAFDLVFEFNKHLLTLIPAFFELLMYIPGIVERGVFGLVQMLIDPVVEKAAGKVLDEFGFDPNLAGFWVGGLALLTHRIKPHVGKQPVRGPEQLGTADSRAFGALPANPRGTGAGAAAVQTRELAGDLAGAQTRGLAGDLARAEPRGHAAAPAATSAEARVSEIVEPKGMTKAGGPGRQFDAPWLDRAATPPAAGQRAAGAVERAVDDAGDAAAGAGRQRALPEQPRPAAEPAGVGPAGRERRPLQQQEQPVGQRIAGDSAPAHGGEPPSTVQQQPQRQQEPHQRQQLHQDQQRLHRQQQQQQQRQQTQMQQEVNQQQRYPTPQQQQQARFGGDPGRKATAGKGVGERATAGRLHGQPSAMPDLPPGTRMSPSGHVMIAEETCALLDPLRKAGFEIRHTGLKAPKSGGAAFQGKHATGLGHEWELSHGKLKADIDGLAADPLKPGGLVNVEAKATFVKNVDRSAHLTFYPDKVESLTRQLVLCLESRGLLRMEILCNAREVAEVYQNMVEQQIVREVRKRFREQARAYIEHATDQAVKRLRLADLDRIVEDHITVTISDWGKLR